MLRCNVFCDNQFNAQNNECNKLVLGGIQGNKIETAPLRQTILDSRSNNNGVGWEAIRRQRGG